MKILQVTTSPINAQLFWMDLMIIPQTVNNLAEFLEAAKKDFATSGRQCRIIELHEGITDLED